MLIQDVFNPGRFGVVLFFLLSGYLIPASLDTKRGVRAFVWGRVLRLYPVYWLSVVAMVATLAVLAPGRLTMAQILANLTMVQRLFGQADVNGVYWSLFIELAFYAICVALFVVGRLRDPRALAATCIGCVMATLVPLWINRGIGEHLPVQFLTHHLAFLFLGGLIREGIERHDDAMRWPFVSAMTVVLISIPFASGLIDAINPLHAPPGSEIGLAVAYGAAIALFVSLCLRPRSLGRGLWWLGIISYPLYVLHTPCVAIARWLSPISDGAGQLGYVVSGLSLSLAAAAAAHYLVERPIQRIARRALRAERTMAATVVVERQSTAD